jgi:hypothetical protein
MVMFSFSCKICVCLSIDKIKRFYLRIKTKIIVNLVIVILWCGFDE